MKRLTKASNKRLAKCDVFLANLDPLCIWFAPRNGGPLEVLVNSTRGSPEWRPSGMRSVQDLLQMEVCVIEVLE